MGGWILRYFLNLKKAGKVSKFAGMAEQQLHQSEPGLRLGDVDLEAAATVEGILPASLNVEDNATADDLLADLSGMKVGDPVSPIPISPI